MEGFQPILSALAVLGLLGGLLWWLRRRGIATTAILPVRRKTGTLQSVERLPLTATHSLHLVRVGDRAILLATSPAGCQLVESAPWGQFERPEAR